MEIRHLQTFIRIIEQDGFTKAAEDLGYAQSTITSHIKLLESEIGQPLFDRLGKKVVLTNVGKRLVPYARQMLGVYKKIQSITDLSNEVSGDLIIGASESLTIYRLGEILKEYKKSFPNVNLILKTAKCSELRSRLYSGEIDMTLTLEPEIMDTDLVVKNLKEECMVMIGAPDTDLEFLELSGEGESLSESIILSEKGCIARAAFENYLQHKKVKYRNPLEFSSIEAIKNCVMNGLGISVLPHYTVRTEIEEGKLKMSTVSQPFAAFRTQMAYHKNKTISVPMDKFIEITLKNSGDWR